MAPATKICPACRTEAELYANICGQCGRKYPAQAFPEEDTALEAPSDPEQDVTLPGLLLTRAQLGICLLGALMSIAGVFMPLLSGGLGFGPLTFMKTNEGPMLIGVGLIAIVCALFCKFTSVAVIGSGMLTFLSTWLIPLWRFTRTQMDSGDGGTDMLHPQYGWLVLILAGLLMILGGSYDLIHQPSDPTDRIVTNRKRVRLALSCLATVASTLLLLMLIHTRSRTLRSPQAARQSVSNASTPIDRSQDTGIKMPRSVRRT